MDTDQDLSIDTIDKRWPWRVGWPRLRPQRVFTLNASEVSPKLASINLEVLRIRIDKILDTYLISSRTTSLVYRTYKHVRANPPHEHLRILIDCRYDPQKHEELPDSWPKATFDIHKVIREILVHLPHSIGVELCDREMEASLHISNFPPGFGDFRLNWSEGLNYREQVHSKFASHPNLWRAMLPTGLEASNKEFKYHECVLWIDALDADHAAWPQIEEEIRSLLLPQGVAVEIWQATGSFLLASQYENTATPSFFPPNDLNADTEKKCFERPPRPGTSIGVVGDKDLGGTLGGYVRVKGPLNIGDGGNSLSQNFTYGITNAHVALGRHPSILRGLLESQEELPRAISRLEIPIQSPFEEDRVELIRELEYLVDHALQSDSELKSLESETTFEEEGTTYPELRKKQIEKKEKVQQLVDRISTVRNQNLQLGYLKAAAFGVRSHYQPEKFRSRLAMDIALVDATDVVPHPDNVCVPDYKLPKIKNRPRDLIVLGLLFARSLDAELAYFIPFEAINKEIEAVTGGEVTWPVKVEAP